MGRRVVLSVAEKPSVAKGLAGILGSGSGQNAPQSRPGKSIYNRIYMVEHDVGHWGRCQINITSVRGHLHETEFVDPYS